MKANRHLDRLRHYADALPSCSALQRRSSGGAETSSMNAVDGVTEQRFVISTMRR